MRLPSSFVHQWFQVAGFQAICFQAICFQALRILPIALAGTLLHASPSAAAPVNPVLFVTQVPTDAFLNVTSAFGAHLTTPQKVPRGGDLWIRYPDGTLRNLTREAGFGIAGTAQDGSSAIAVRQPTVHWSGTKALFSMLVGAPAVRFEQTDFRWQIYEVTGLGRGATASIARVACQSAEHNNIAPIYASDDQIVFVSDRPRNGAAHLYPQRDEYESEPVDTGLWKLDRTHCRFRLIEHAPSGVTYPSIETNGRIVFTKWDHLQRDQQADADAFDGGSNGTFNYDSEEQVTPPALHSRREQFPEFRRAEYSGGGATIAPDYPFSDHTFNHFFPWMVHQDGSEEETLLHAGRHELGGSFSSGSHRNDPDLGDIQNGRFNGATNFLPGDGGMFHLREDPTRAGRFWGTASPEFSTATTGDLVRLDAFEGTNPDTMKVDLVGEAATFGRFRNPLPLANGTLLAVHTTETGTIANRGSGTSPDYNYELRIRTVVPQSGGVALGAFLTPGITRTVQYWDPDQRVTWTGRLWELDPVEVRERPAPPVTRAPALPNPERAVLATLGIEEALLRNWLQQQGLALLVSRNVTSRDRSDTQQPYNLRVAGSSTQTIGAPGGTVYTVSHMQFYQADQLRGYARGGVPQAGGRVEAGRRVLAVPLHDPAALRAMSAHASLDIPGATPLGSDGSMAAFVPAGRAMAWQLVDEGSSGPSRAVVRERNWVSFKPGETRVCANCHGTNTVDQAGAPPPNNAPEALVSLLTEWTRVVRNFCPANGGTGRWSFDGVPFGPVEDGRRFRIQTCQGGNGCCDGLPATESDAGGGTPLSFRRIATGADAGGGPHVRTFDVPSGSEIELFAYGSGFTGGVRVAVADVNGDGAADLVTGAGAGGGPHVRVFDGLTGQPLPGPIGSFFPYSPSFTGGVYVAAGDVDGDGRADVVTGAGGGGGPHVRVFSGATGNPIREFFAYAPGFTGGVRVATGDVDGDGRADIITGPGPGGGPHVRVFSGATGAEIRSFFAYDSRFTGGLFVAGGDLDRDGRADLITGPDAGGGPHLRVFSGATGAEMHSVFAYDPAFTGGVRVAAVDRDGDGRADVVTAPGPGGGPHIRVLSGLDGRPLLEFFAYDAGFTGGAFVASGS